MKFIIFILFAYANIVFAQFGKLSGTVVNENNQILVGANISVNEIYLKTTSNLSGNFIFSKIPTGKYTLTVSHIGYKPKIDSIFIKNEKTINLKIALSVSQIYTGEVKVISTKSEKLERDISLPMEVIGSKVLEAGSYISISDALKNEPGLAIARDGVWGTHVSIRGLSRNNIVTLVDGNRVETSNNLAAGLSMIDVNDIERIEVIKGGASSLYGTGATGGVINIQTKGGIYNDSFKLNGSFLSGFNSVNNGSLGNISVNAGASNWFAKLSGSIRNAENTETPEGTLENSQFHDNNISVLFGFIPFENNELQVSYQNFKATDVGIPGGKTFPVTATASYPIEERKMFSAEYKINNLSEVLANTSVKYFHQTLKREVLLIPSATVKMTPGADHIIDGIQLQTNWLFGKKHWVVSGIDAWQREYNGHREKTISNLNKIIGDIPIPNSKFQSVGIFAQDEIRLIDNKLSLTVGGRFDQIHITSDDARNPNYIIVNGVRNDSPPSNPQASFKASNTYNHSWSANIGMLYNLMTNIDLTLNLARTFRSPNLEERFQYIDLGGNIYLGNPDLNPEQGYFFDAGIRIWNSNFTLKGNVFYNSFYNLVIDKEVISDSLFIKNNVGEARLYGFDFSLEYNFYKEMVLYSSIAYVRGEDTGNDLDLPEIAPLNGRLGFRTKLTDLFNLNFTASVFAEQDKIAQGEEKTPGYATFDCSFNTTKINLSLANLELFAGIENITDVAYRNHLATNRGLIRWEPGRNLFIKAKLSW
ncbi:MAG: TonB-dependent receptor [Bacteroidetes bacterium]|nr:TonB-dependent receptor [Bacteroidota bacterium]MBU1116448.1 TonB-dependent receptor [Bacteroidota bacterium]MBU1800027.1 TonB-dependent receptor [Bacteroidota bacterium]